MHIGSSSTFPFFISPLIAWIAWIVWIVALSLCLLSSCQQKKTVHQIPPVEVSVERIAPNTIPTVFEYIGVVQSSHEVEIRARLSGYLETISYLEGSFVKKGDLLFQIDPRPFQA